MDDGKLGPGLGPVVAGGDRLLVGGDSPVVVAGRERLVRRGEVRRLGGGILAAAELALDVAEILGRGFGHRLERVGMDRNRERQQRQEDKERAKQGRTRWKGHGIPPLA